jgi:hypothetical protein
MDSFEAPEKKKSTSWFSNIHYLITLIFFFLILINIISLTITTINMNVPPGDTDGTTAKNLMISAQVITYVGLLTVLIFLGVTYSYSSHKTSNYYEQMMGLTGGENVYAAMRIVTFSILMFISLIVSALCLSAANYISMSNYSSQYTDQYNICIDLGKMFMIHFILFSSIQGASYIYQYYYSEKKIYSDPNYVNKKMNKTSDEKNVNISDWIPSTSKTNDSYSEKSNNYNVDANSVDFFSIFFM